MERKKNFKNLLGEKKDLWEIKFIDKMLFFSDLNEKNLKKIQSIKKFNLASFSIDTSARLYAEKVDSLYFFVSKFLKSLIKKKTVNSKKIPKELEKGKETIITLKTNLTKQATQRINKNLFKKSISFFCFPIFINLDFYLFLENFKKYKILLKKINSHKKKFLTIISETSLNFWDLKEINFKSLKIINYQNSLQIINPKKIFFSEFYPINKLTEKKISLCNSSSKIEFDHTNFSENFFLKRISLKKFHRPIFLKKKKSINFKKKKKEVYFFDFIFSKKISYFNPKPFSFSLPQIRFFNYFLNSWNNFFFKKIFYFSKKIKKISKKSQKNYWDSFNSNDKEFSFLSVSDKNQNFLKIGGGEKEFLEFEKKFKTFSFIKNSFFFIKSHEFIYFLKKFENQKIKIVKNKMDKKLDFQKKKTCFFAFIYPKPLFIKCLKSLNYRNKIKKNFINYLICFLHNAFQEALLLISDINLNNFLIFMHL
ncbi:hypothetical protein HAN_2g273 (nucleomorph) [Hemiselmis andersenii]|uniref:Uncharacterized protein n=2 Tax=Hemiselmis andersenii TaxID=464988 RepID=A9BKU1_HEMAN|nr:hypothetical protein HAN_2g273 [Hemiselmis andersenii]ABW98096.1 hypothetical protein HAN_2g273 [Hemiselmis andersenii]